MLCFVSFCFVGLPEIRVFCHKIYGDVQHGCNAFSKIFRTPWLSSVQFKGSQGIPFFLQERREKQKRISKVIYYEGNVSNPNLVVSVVVVLPAHSEK